MQRKTVIVHGNQTVPDKILISLASKASGDARNFASFQIVTEHNVLTILLALEEVREVMEKAAPGSLHIIGGRMSNDYLIANFPRSEKGVVCLTAVCGGSRCLTAHFPASDIKNAVSSLLSQKG